MCRLCADAELRQNTSCALYDNTLGKEGDENEGVTRYSSQLIPNEEKNWLINK